MSEWYPPVSDKKEVFAACRIDITPYAENQYSIKLRTQPMNRRGSVEQIILDMNDKPMISPMGYRIAKAFAGTYKGGKVKLKEVNVLPKNLEKRIDLWRDLFKTYQQSLNKNPGD